VALEENVPVLQPEKPSGDEFLDSLRALEPDLGVVVAYGHILKPALLALPAKGMINVHASLLPALRGAAPIQAAILQGLTQTGISIMYVEQELDAGPVLHRVETDIAPDETGGELTERLAELGALALIEALSMLDGGGAKPEPQDHGKATYAPKLTHASARIDWAAPSDKIERLIRALDPKPGAWCEFKGRELKLFGPREADAAPPGGSPGQIIATDPAFLVATTDGALQFLDVQPAGKPRLAAADWVRGRGAAAGDRLA
jgi:methionyl-tRNA formyltransferase